MGVCGKSFRVLAQRLNPRLDIDRVPQDTPIHVPTIHVCLPSDRGEPDSGELQSAPEYALYVPMSPSAAIGFRRQIEWLAERNITVDGWGKAAAVPLSSHNMPITVNSYLKLPFDQQCQLGKEAALVSMVSRLQTPLPQRCTVQLHTQIDIIDHSRDTPHRDFQPNWTGTEECQMLNTSDNNDHATGLLGIIKAQSNDRGVQGLYPDARTKAWWWDGQRSADGALDGSQIYDELKNQQRTRLKVTVVASKWLPHEEQSLTRFLQNGRGSEVKSEPDDKRLWVVSAGDESDVEKRHLQEGGSDWPQVRGRQSNVLVVTGCDDCLDIEKARVLDNFRFDDRLVHVAAPAVKVPTTKGDTGLCMMEGTSPATAFVAAIATLLADCYPELGAADIKERLQFTSRPLPLMQDARKLAAGIVDPDVALLSPRTVNLKRMSGGGAVEPFADTDIEGWCVKEINVLDPVTGSKLGDNSRIDPETIERIVNIPSTTGTSWVFYRSSHEYGGLDAGRVVRIGPGTLGPVRGDSPGAHNMEGLLKLKDGTILSLNQIDDIVGTPEISTKVLRPDDCEQEKK
ncbi:S8/S53 family peptidase [Methylomonas methanica]|nr:S8/S53 family peptidase [Methylomonas methanica]